MGIAAAEWKRTSHAAARCVTQDIDVALSATQRIRRHLSESGRDLHASRREERDVAG